MFVMTEIPVSDAAKLARIVRFYDASRSGVMAESIYEVNKRDVWHAKVSGCRLWLMSLSSYGRSRESGNLDAIQCKMSTMY